MANGLATAVSPPLDVGPDGSADRWQCDEKRRDLSTT
jgi:hypothetical protein